MLTEWREAASRHLPDFKTLMAAGQDSLGPAAGTALAVFAVGLLVTRKRAPVAAAALAMLAAVGVANYFHPVVNWWPGARSRPGPPTLPADPGPRLPVVVLPPGPD